MNGGLPGVPTVGSTTPKYRPEQDGWVTAGAQFTELAA